jgi:hypothetical protein
METASRRFGFHTNRLIGYTIACKKPPGAWRLTEIEKATAGNKIGYAL